MATAFVRTFDLLRILERSFSHIERVRHAIKTSPNEFLRNYVQCHCYHATSTCFMGKSKKEKKFVPAIVKPKNQKVIEVWRNMTIFEFAIQAGRSVSDVEEALSIVNITNYSARDPVSDTKVFPTISKILGVKCKGVKPPGQSVEEVLTEEEIHTRSPIDEASLIKRRPIVTVMGHVDHGKTTLLDALRSTSVVESEFGGITQHIGAFNVTLETGETMTFLDTPGHAAFTAMRARGAQVTDIVVLVVAADDGVMAQTVQSIEMAKEAKVPIVVAINKIDRPNADVTRTQKMLAQHGILVEEIGGDIQAIQISALHKTNLNTLVEAIAIQADMMNLKGDPKGLAEGVVVECSNDPHRGKLATVLVQRGLLKRGTIVVCGLAWAKVRSMFDDAGNFVPKASLSDAVQVIGWRQMPSVGDEFFEVENEAKANRLIKFRESQVNLQKSLNQEIAATAKLQAIRHEYEAVRKQRAEISRYRHIKWIPSTDNKQDDTNKLNVIVKGDVSGSVEAILDIFETYNQEKDCRLNVVHYGVGDITETDVTMAEMFDGIIYRFNVNVPLDLSHKAKEKNISIRPFKIIYKLIDDLKDELNKNMPMQEIEDVHGEAMVLQEFKVTEQKKKVNVAGCSCTKGNLKMSAKFRLLRNGEVIHSGSLASMRHMKEEVETIKTNTECGLRFKDNDVSFQKGDVIVCYSTRMGKVQLKWNPGF